MSTAKSTIHLANQRLALATLSTVADLAGRTFGQIDNVMSLIHAEKESPHHPWRERAAVGMKIVRDNAPFMNLWATSIFM